MRGLLLSAFVALSLVGLFAACGDKYGYQADPQLGVVVGGTAKQLIEEVAHTKGSEQESCPTDWVSVTNLLCCPVNTGLGPDGKTCHEFFKFQPLGEGETASEVKVEIANNGDKDLVVKAIYFQEDLDAEAQNQEPDPVFSLKWSGAYDQDSFPITIAPDLPTAILDFAIVYDPTPGVQSLAYKTLVIETNDRAFAAFQWRFRMIVTVQNVGPSIKVNRSSITFSCVTGCSSETIIIDNDGTDTLTVMKIDLASPSGEFTPQNSPPLPADIEKKGDPAYNSISFSLQYCPVDEYYDDANTLRIKTNDMTHGGGVLEIPIAVVQSPAILEFAQDSSTAYLDFSAGGSHWLSMYNKHEDECKALCAKGNCCGCPVQLKPVSFEPQEAADWYTVTAKDPATEQVLDLSKGRALKGGGGIKFEVAYQKPAGQTQDMNGTLCINYVAPLVGAQEYCVTLMALSQCDLSFAPVNMLIHFNSDSPTLKKEKPVVLVNNGSAACNISHVSLTDKWQTGTAKDFTFRDGPVPGDTKVGPFGLFPIWVSYKPAGDPSGYMMIDYEDAPAPAAITLKGDTKPVGAQPVADPGSDYSATAGTTVTLNGCASKGGNSQDGGNPIYAQGYLWFLLSKPEGSAAQLNVEGGCVIPFTPDVAGKYEVGLIVYDDTNFYQSDLAVLALDVAAAE
jgi:hypothetical protein